MRRSALSLFPGIRDVIGAWLVCVAVAVGCFGLLQIEATTHAGRPEALISPEPTITVASVDTDRTERHRHGRC
jgi:hypothetical protein